MTQQAAKIELPVYLTGEVTTQPQNTDQGNTVQFMMTPEGGRLASPLPIHCTGTIAQWVTKTGITEGTTLILRGSIQKGNRGYFIHPDTIGQAHKGHTS